MHETVVMAYWVNCSSGCLSLWMKKLFYSSDIRCLSTHSFNVRSGSQENRLLLRLMGHIPSEEQWRKFRFGFCMPFSCIKSAMTSQFCEVSKKNSFCLAPPQHSYIKNKQNKQQKNCLTSLRNYTNYTSIKIFGRQITCFSSLKSIVATRDLPEGRRNLEDPAF